MSIELIRALEYCRTQFESYRNQHIAKRTADSLRKAAANQEHIDFIDAAITDFTDERDSKVSQSDVPYSDTFSRSPGDYR